MQFGEGNLLRAFVDYMIDIANEKGAFDGSIAIVKPISFGTLDMNRCRTENEFQKTVDFINNFKKYFMRYGEKVDKNPSPGNKVGGITTLEDKALGCTQKCGTAPVEDVLSYLGIIFC